MSKHPISKSQK